MYLEDFFEIELEMTRRRSPKCHELHSYATLIINGNVYYEDGMYATFPDYPKDGVIHFKIHKPFMCECKTVTLHSALRWITHWGDQNINISVHHFKMNASPEN